MYHTECFAQSTCEISTWSQRLPNKSVVRAKPSYPCTRVYKWYVPHQNQGTHSHSKKSRQSSSKPHWLKRLSVFLGTSSTLFKDLLQPSWTTTTVASHDHWLTLLFLERNGSSDCEEEVLRTSFPKTDLPFDYSKNGQNWHQEQSNHSFTDCSQHCGTRISSTM
jgi:hypothetical protein